MQPEYVTKEHCGKQHDLDDKRHGEVMDAIKSLDDRLYKDNGKGPSIQTRLDRADRVLIVLIWVVTIGGGAMIVQVVAKLMR